MSTILLKVGFCPSEIAASIGFALTEFGGEFDHIRFLLRYLPIVNSSNAVGILKRRRASALLNKFDSFYRNRLRCTL